MTSPVIHRTKLDPGSGREVVARLAVKVWSNNALSVHGPLEQDKAWCLAALDAAMRTLQGVRIPPPPVPESCKWIPLEGDEEPNLDPTTSTRLEVAAQLEIAVWSDGAMSHRGPVTDKAWCLAALSNAKDAVRNHRSAKDAIVIPSKDVEVIAPLHPLTRPAAPS